MQEEEMLGKTPPNGQGKPTQKTIALLTGLSVPTVSRALKDAPDIGQRTKEKVRAVAAEIGYVPNRAGVLLRTGRTNVISLALSTQPDLTNHFGAIISAIAEGLRNTKFHLNVMPFESSGDLMKPIRYVVENGTADAIIFNESVPDDPRVRYLMDRNFPFVSHGRDNRCDQHAYYDFDNGAAARIGVRALHQRGRRNLLVIPANRALSYAEHMIEGAQDAARAAKVSLTVHPTIRSEIGRTSMMRGIHDYLREHPEIDGLVCASASVAIGAVGGLEMAGRTLGKDIDVFTKEAASFLDWYRPEIIRVSEDVPAAGAFLARAALQAITNPSAPPMQHLEVPSVPEGLT